jgi:hypothetical protein
LRERLPLPERLLLLRDEDERDEPLPLRDEDERDEPPLRDDEPPLREDELDLRVVDDEPPLRLRDDEPLPEDDERDEDDRDDEPLLRLRDELDRRDDVRRSAAGISSCATAFVSCGISFSRNFAMRSSSRLMPRAIFAVSLSPTTSARVSIDV